MVVMICHNGTHIYRTWFLSLYLRPHKCTSCYLKNNLYMFAWTNENHISCVQAWFCSEISKILLHQYLKVFFLIFFKSVTLIFLQVKVIQDSRPIHDKVVDSFLNKFFPSGYPYRYEVLRLIAILDKSAGIHPIVLSLCY